LPNHRETLSYYAVFDGHAGPRAADFCARHMHKVLAGKLSKALAGSGCGLAHTEKDMRRLFLETFKQCDEEFLRAASSK
jgi:integrin-linked kinase-associated serine/threonine phosphatase 2C